MEDIANKNDLEIIKHKYFNFFGIFPYYLKGRFGKDKGGSFSTELKNGESSIYNFAAKVLRPVEKAISPPIGLSELIVLRKK